MTQPDALRQCAYDGCTNTWEPSRTIQNKRFCSRSCVAKQTHGRPVLLRTCKSPECDVTFEVLDHPQKRFCSRSCASSNRDKSIGALATLSEYDSDRGPRRDPYAAVCCHCGRTATYLQLSAVQLRALRPLPRCGACGGPVWVEPAEPTAHRVGDVSPGRTANPVAGWNYHEPVGEVAG